MKSFTLDATVSTDKPSAILPALKRLAGKGATVKKAVAGTAKREGEGVFVVHASVKGESSKDLNRALLSSLRAIEKKTRLRAEWKAQETTERYFDYVLKKTFTPPA